MKSSGERQSARLPWVCLLGALMVGGCSTVTTTQVVVVLRGEGVVLTHGARLRVEIEREEGDLVAGLPVIELAPPRADAELARVPVIPRDGDASRAFTLRASVEDADGELVATLAPTRVTFVADELTEVSFVLRSECEGELDGTACGECRECAAGLCRELPLGTTCGECRACGASGCGIAADGVACGPCEGDTCSAGECQVATPVQQVVSGANHACALLHTMGSNRVYCWGANGYGQLGRGPGEADPTPSETLVVPGFPRDLAGDSDTTCVINGSGNRWCWGRNNFGQFGSGSAMGSIDLPTMMSEPASLRSLSGSIHFCGIDVDASLHCWGYNARRQTGVAVGGDVRSPVRFDALPGARWVRVEAAGLHTCAIREAGASTHGELWCWGYNDTGALGDGTFGGEGGTPSRATPMRAGCASPETCFDDWEQVSQGEFHTCALRRGGALYCWGGSANGQLGLGTSVLDGDVPTPMQVVGPWAGLSAGARTTCAVRAGDAALFCWGVGGSGQLGDGSVTAVRDAPVPVVPPRPGHGWLSVEVGRDHACGILDDRSVWCWGANDQGQLGQGEVSESPQTTPTRVCF